MNNTPLLSILFPTRNRAEILDQCISSLRNGFGQHMSIEICVKIDDDDIASFEALRKLAGPDLKVIVSPQGRGYMDLPEYHNSLYGVATGRYLQIWNDDAILTDPGDLKYRLEEYYEIPSFIFSAPYCWFPATHRSIYEWIEQKHGNNTSSGLFGDILYFDGYMHGIAQYFPEIRAPKDSTYRYIHYGTTHSPEALKLIEKIGWEKGYREVESTKELMRNSQNAREGHPGSRVLSDWRYIKWRWFQDEQQRLERSSKNIL